MVYANSMFHFQEFIHMTRLLKQRSVIDEELFHGNFYVVFRTMFFKNFSNLTPKNVNLTQIANSTYSKLN